MTIYNYPCSVCNVKFDWAIPEPRLGNTCPKCKDAMMDQLVAWGEGQGKDEERLHEQMDNWWDGLTMDAREKAFFSVVKRLTQYECREDLSYRQVLDRFGFDGSGSGYYLGINCGFMELHNCIVPHDEMQEMRRVVRTQRGKEAMLREALRIKSQCDLCGYQSTDIRAEDSRPCPHHDCNGSMK